MILKLIDKQNETSNVISFHFSAQGGSASGGEPTDSFKWKAGQFLVYKLKHENPDLRGIQRFFTISSPPFEKHIIITTHIEKNASSTFKKAWDNIKIGDFIETKGPYGDFVVSEPKENYVFIAGGIGITPFRSIITDLSHKKLPLNIILLYANKTDEFPFKEELENISSKHSNFNIHFVVSPIHIDQKYIEQNVKNIQNKIFYISGPEQMVEDLGEMLKGLGIPEDRIKQDYFSGYDPI